MENRTASQTAVHLISNKSHLFVVMCFYFCIYKDKRLMQSEDPSNEVRLSF